MHITPEALFLLQAVIFIVTPFLLWQLKFVRSIAPLVVVQIILGILLGPSVLGNLAPEVFAKLYPSKSLTLLNGLSWLGISLFGFLAGLHFDLKAVSRKSKQFLLTSFSTLLIPFALGALVASAFLSEAFTSPGVASWVFITGVATAIAVTALPVLSALLIELGLIDKPLGRRVLGYAVMNDMLLWVIITVLTGYTSITTAHTDHLRQFAVTAGLMVLFLTFMVTVVSKVCRHLAATHQLSASPSSAQLAIVVGGILASGFATEVIGVHFLLGTFVFGAVMPKTISHGLYQSFEKFTMLVLLPFFFILTGLKTSFSLNSTDTWLLFGAATLVAMIGKIIGTAIPELLMKADSSTAIKAGILMQTKGLMEVVVLNILLSAGIINTIVFSALVLMAVVTTLLTKPLLLVVDKLADRQKLTA